MSKTDASSEALPNSQVAIPEQEQKPEPVSESGQCVPCRENETESLSQSGISVLRAFFELLDAWDQEMPHGD